MGRRISRAAAIRAAREKIKFEDLDEYDVAVDDDAKKAYVGDEDRMDDTNEPGPVWVQAWILVRPRETE